MLPWEAHVPLLAMFTGYVERANGRWDTKSFSQTILTRTGKGSSRKVLQQF